MGLFMIRPPWTETSSLFPLYASPYICQSVLVAVVGAGDYHLKQRITRKGGWVKSSGRKSSTELLKY